LTQALKITKKQNELDLADKMNNKFLYIEESGSTNNLNNFIINKTARVGVSIGMEKQWRYTMLLRTSSGGPFIASSFLSRRS
jgi:3-methyladenine DNA glycosylase Mpg